MRETASGRSVVGGRDAGGRAMFCAERQDVSVTLPVTFDTYELKFGLATWCDANGLNALFTRDGVVKAEEGLVRLDAVALVGFGDLEGEFENVGGAEVQWLWLLGEGESVGWGQAGCSGSRSDIRVCAQLRSIGGGYGETGGLDGKGGGIDMGDEE